MVYYAERMVYSFICTSSESVRLLFHSSLGFLSDRIKTFYLHVRTKSKCLCLADCVSYHLLNADRCSDLCLFFARDGYRLLVTKACLYVQCDEKKKTVQAKFVTYSSVSILCENICV